MQILVNSGNNVDSNQTLIEQVQNEVAHAVRWFEDRITRVEVHLTDENSEKGGAQDKKCVMEAHVSGRDPYAVSTNQETIHAAYSEAAGKLQRSIKSDLDRIDEKRRGIDEKEEGPPS